MIPIWTVTQFNSLAYRDQPRFLEGKPQEVFEIAGKHIMYSTSGYVTLVYIGCRRDPRWRVAVDEHGVRCCRARRVEVVLCAAVPLGVVSILPITRMPTGVSPNGKWFTGC